MKGEPDGDGEEDDGDETGETPAEVMGLNGENGNHEIIGKAGVAEETAVLGEALAQSAEKRDETEGKDKEGDDHIDCFKPSIKFPRGNEVGKDPLRGGPKKAEAGLNGGAKIGFGGGQFVEKEAEIKRDDPPNHRHGFKGGGKKRFKSGPIQVHGY
jgi:hypothetical protein